METLLLWIVLLDTAFYKDDGDRYVMVRQQEPAGILVRRLRYARNRLTHDIMVYGMLPSGPASALQVMLATWKL